MEVSKAKSGEGDEHHHNDGTHTHARGRGVGRIGAPPPLPSPLFMGAIVHDKEKRGEGSPDCDAKAPPRRQERAPNWAGKERKRGTFVALPPGGCPKGRRK